MSGAAGTPIRNVALVSSVGTGKTSLAEAMLFAAGAIPTMGSVGQGTTVSDFEPEEQARHHSLTASLLQFEWQGASITLIDTPGDRNFQGEALAALRAVDGVLLVVSAHTPVRSDMGRLWTVVRSLRLPALLFVTDLDKDGASLDRTLASCRELLEEVRILPLSLPGGRTPAGDAVVDLLQDRLVVSNRESSKAQPTAIPSPLATLVAESKKPLVEAAAEADDALLERYVTDGALPPDDVRLGLMKATHAGQLLPAFGGAALHNLGVVPLLDAIVALLPSPSVRDADGWSGTDPRDQSARRRKADESEPLSALVFKTLIDPFMGRMSYVRVRSGILKADTTVFNSSRGIREKGGHLFTVFGKKYNAVPALSAGQIGAVGKLKETQTGDTLCDEHAPILYPPLDLPRPVLSVAIDPKSKTDVEKVSLGLHKIVEEDPTLGVTRHDETKELVLSGLGQLHLDVAVERLRRKYGVDVALHTPRVPYKETIRHPASAQGKYKKQTGGHGQYGDCWLQIAPLGHGQGFVFENKIVGGAIPRNFIPAVEKGVVEAMREGILAGYPVVDVQVAVYDGSYHVVDSSEMAFKIAGSMAFKKAMEAAQPVLLEPLMHVEVTCPDDHVGAVIGDLNARRGRITTVTARGHLEVIQAVVPLAEMLKFAPTLNALTGGRGDYTMEFSAYEEVPRELTAKVIEEARAGKSAAATV